MRLNKILRSSTIIASMALWGFAGSVAAPTSAAAETLIPMPSGLCTWDYGSPGTDVLFSRLAARPDFDPSMGYVTANCATALCKADWSGEGAKATIALIQKGGYYGDLVKALGKSCPDALGPLTEGATASIVTPFVSGQENDSSGNSVVDNGGDEPPPPPPPPPDDDNHHGKGGHHDKGDHHDQGGGSDHGDKGKGGDHSTHGDRGDGDGGFDHGGHGAPYLGEPGKPGFDDDHGHKGGHEAETEVAQ